MKLNNISFSLENTKMGIIPSVSITRLGACRKDAPCYKECYCNKGSFSYQNVREAHTHNLAQYIMDSEGYFNTIIDFINNGNVIYKYFRWHVAGEVVDNNYLLGIIKVAKSCKLTKFLLFTKKYEIINDYVANGGKIPNNLTIIFSHWDLAWESKVINPYNFGGSYVEWNSKKSKFEHTNCVPKNAFRCLGDCSNCHKCWELKKGQSVVFEKH